MYRQPIIRKHITMDIKLKSWEKVMEESSGELDNIYRVIQRCKSLHPKKEHIFNFLDVITLDEVKVIMIGGAPSHKTKQENIEPISDGMAYSTLLGEERMNDLSYILKDMLKYKAINKIPEGGNLLEWAQQGVLLLNYSLTCDASLTKYDEKQHIKKRLWLPFIVKLINAIYAKNKNVIFIGCDKNSVSIKKMCNLSNNRRFIEYWKDKDAFNQCNTMLTSMGENPIIWQYEDQKRVPVDSDDDGYDSAFD